jgi:hypothetical protein
VSDYYAVTIRLGDLDPFTVYDKDTAVDGGLSEGERVLDSLHISWNIPAGIFPAPPDPGYASLAIRIPDFSTSELATLVEGSPVGIEVVIEADADPVATFYGRLTDLSASMNTGRGVTGVTLSLAAGDYVPDLLTKGEWIFTPEIGEDITAAYVLERLWVDHVLGDFPSIAITDVDLVDVPTGEPLAVTEWIETILAPWIFDIPGTSDIARLIVAPNIDASTGLPDADQPWTFDAIRRDADAGLSYYIPSDAIHTGTMNWRFDRNKGPTKIVVTYGSGGEAYASGEVVVPAPRVEQIDTWLDDALGTLASEVAAFYLPASLDSWRIDTFRFQLNQLDDEAERPGNFFPRHAGFIPDITAARSSCYGLPIRVLDVPTHRVPGAVPLDPDNPVVDVEGRLAGAALTIVGGRVYVDATVRHTTI